MRQQRCKFMARLEGRGQSGRTWTQLIVDAFWMATCLAAAVFTAPLELHVFFLSLLSWTETHRSKGKRGIG